MNATPLPHAYVISLVEAVERRAVMAERLTAAGLDFSFLDAVDGRGFDVARQPIYDGPRRRAKYGHDMIGGEVGCLMSHRAALRQVVAAGRGPALVFEDDAIPHPDLPKVVAALMQRPDRWELVRFLSSAKIARQRKRRILALGDGYWMTRLWSVPGGAHAYLVSEDGARKLLRWLDHTPFPIDTLMGRSWKTGLGTFTVQPGLASQDQGFESYIGDDRFVTRRQIYDANDLKTRVSMGLHKLGENIAMVATYAFYALSDRLHGS